MDIIQASNTAKSSSFFGSKHEFIETSPVVELQDVIVTRKNSMILSLKKEPIFSVSNEILFWRPSCMNMGLSDEKLAEEVSARQNILCEDAAAIDIDNLIRISGKNLEIIYLMHSFGWYAYGHLFDTLQRLFPIESPDKSKRHLLVSDARRVSDFAGHLGMLGYGVNQLISIPPQADGLILDYLCVPQSPAVVTQFTHQTMGWIRKCYLESPSYEEFSARFSRYFPVSSGYTLFLDRSSVGRRNISNITEVTQTLSQKSSHVITFTGTESAHEMLYLFSNAGLVVGAHGAMFVNTIFCSPEARIIEFCPINRRVENMVRMCKPALDHYFVPCVADQGGSITVDILTLTALLE